MIPDLDRALTRGQRVAMVALLDAVAVAGGPELLLVGATAIRAYLSDDARLVASTDQDFAVSVASREALVGLIPRASPFDGTHVADLRWIHRETGVPVDLVPFGPIEDPEGSVRIGGPADTLFTLGLRAAWASAVRVEVQGRWLRVPTLPHLLALKLLFWGARRDPKHLGDAARILGALPAPNEEEMFSDEGLLEHMASGALNLDDAPVWFAARELATHLNDPALLQLRQVVDQLHDGHFGVRTPMRAAPPRGDLDDEDARALRLLCVLGLGLREGGARNPLPGSTLPGR